MIPLFKTFVHPDAVLAVAQCFHSGYIGQGPKVDEFERALEPWIGKCVTVNSGTSALTLAYDLAGITRTDTVIATPITCLATNMPLAQVGCNVLWADCDPRSGLIDPDSVHALLAKRSAQAVVVVDYGGQLPDLERLRLVCNWDRVALIEDCAHSFGSYGHGAADFEAYSFQAIKSLTTGDGGALRCRFAGLTELARLKRWFGLDRSKGGFRCEQVVHDPGYKFHMNDIAASIGLANLPHIEANITTARRNAASYDQAGIGAYHARSSCWLHTITVPDRDKFIAHMESRGVQCARVHSSNKIHPIFRAPECHTPGADEFDAKQVSIPCGWWLTDEDVQHVIKSVQEVL